MSNSNTGLLIQISGDATKFEDALRDAKKETEDLSGQLESIAKYSAVAFAVLTAEAYESVKAFGNAEKASNLLTTALQQQGIYSTSLIQQYRDIAMAVEEKTGAEHANVQTQMAMLQSMIGQTKITKELAFAISDFAQVKMGGDLAGAYGIVGKAIDGNMTMLQRYGLHIQDTGTRAGNLALLTKILGDQFKGQAEAAATGVNSWVKVKALFDDLQESIGERLAPAVVAIETALINFFKTLDENKGMLDLIVSAGAALAVVSGLGIAVGGASVAFLAFRAALVASGVAIEASTLLVRGLVGATGIGLLVLILSEVYLNWNSIWPKMQQIFKGFVDGIVALASGVGKIISGMFHLDPAKIKEGLNDILAASLKDCNQIVKEAAEDRKKIDDKAEQDRIDKNNKNAAAVEAKLRAHEQIKLEILKQGRNLLVMEAQNASKEDIDLKKQEIAVLTAMEDEKNAKILGKLRAHLAEVRALQQKQFATEKEERNIFDNQIAAQTKEYQALSTEERAEFDKKNKNALVASLNTEKQARQQAAKDALDIQIKAHNEFLKNQLKFGKSYAEIDKVMHSEIFKGTQTATSDLAALQQSSNSTLKGIGQAAAIANIAIKTAEAAMDIYAGFATIPIIGPALGIAGAAAAVAFGAEQASAVTAAADGGLITGGIPGKDSVHALLMPGEMVVPTRNFEEVVSAVASSRSGDSSQGGKMNGELTIRLQQDLVPFIELEMTKRSRLGISLLKVS